MVFQKLLEHRGLLTADMPNGGYTRLRRVPWKDTEVYEVYSVPGPHQSIRVAGEFDNFEDAYGLFVTFSNKMLNEQITDPA